MPQIEDEKSFERNQLSELIFLLIEGLGFRIDRLAAGFGTLYQLDDAQDYIVWDVIQGWAIHTPA